MTALIDFNEGSGTRRCKDCSAELGIVEVARKRTVDHERTIGRRAARGRDIDIIDFHRLVGQCLMDRRSRALSSEP